MPTYTETISVTIPESCRGTCCDEETVPCCNTDISTILYMTIASDCAKLDGLVITMTYDSGDLRWEGYEPPSATWCEVLVTASCQEANKIHFTDIFVNGQPLNLTEVESECDPLSVIVTGTQNDPEMQSCCPGATFTGTLTE